MYKLLKQITRKHWAPVYGSPLWTGSVDYLRTGPRTTPIDPSADHPQNKIEKKEIKISLTECPIDHLCQRNFACYAGLRWVNVTDLCSDFSDWSLQIIASLPFSLLWLFTKDQEASEICDFFPFTIFFCPLSRVQGLVPDFILPLLFHGVAIMNEW